MNTLCHKKQTHTPLKKQTVFFYFIKQAAIHLQTSVTESFKYLYFIQYRLYIYICIEIVLCIIISIQTN